MTSDLYIPAAVLFLLAFVAQANPVTETDIVAKECQRIGVKLGSISSQECMERDLKTSGGISVKGTPILIKEYPPVKGKTPLGRVLLIGGFHGDEYSSISVVFKWLQILDKFHTGLFHWQVIPLLNPDGLLQSSSKRMNAHGVDLNRNFPMPDWQEATRDYWLNTTNKSPRHYPGPAPLSEPESWWLVKEINSFKPDVIVSVHAPYGIVDYDGPRDAPHKLGRLYLNLLGTYPGSLGNYAGVQKQIPVVTIELPYAGIMPTPAEIYGIWRDLIRWLIKHLPATPMARQINQDTEPS